MAPGMSQVRVYVSDTSDVSIFNKMATDNISKSLSCSWGWSPADPTSDDPIFKEFAVQGQNLFVASGDSGAYKSGSRYVYPADDAYVTSVGGTDLTTSGAGGPWKSETAWVDSGGGISPNKIAIPSYQKTSGVITTANQRIQDLPEFSRCCCRSEHGQLHLLRRYLRGRMGRNQFCGASLGGLSGVGQSTGC